MPYRQHDTYLNDEQNGVKMQKVDTKQVVKRKLKEPISNNMKNNNYLRAQRWNPLRK